MIRKKGVYYYCNLSSTCIIDKEGLDVKKFPDGKVIVLDEDEFELHQRKMDYGEDLVDIIVSEKNKLVEQAKQSLLPFDEDLIYKYFNLYFNVKEK